MQDSLGLIEVTGLALAITVADVMAKTASVRLLGVERTIGSGWMLVKLDGDVAAVRTALAAGEQTAKAEKGFISCTTIARPAPGTSEMVAASLRQPASVRQRDDGQAKETAARVAAAAGHGKPAQDLAPVIESSLAQKAVELAPETAPVLTPATTSDLAPETESGLTTAVAPDMTTETEPVLTPATVSDLAPETESGLTPTVAPELAPETEPVLTPASASDFAPETKSGLTTATAAEFASEIAPVLTPVAAELAVETAPVSTPAVEKPAAKRRRTRIK